MKKTLDKMDKKTKPGKPTKPVKHPEREHKPRPLDDDAMPPIITGGTRNCFRRNWASSNPADTKCKRLAFLQRN